MQKRKISIIIIMIILLIFFLFWIINKIGRIGDENIISASTNIIKITENNREFGKLENLNIFANPQFQNEKIIAPMSESTYKFVINNTFNEKIKYSIQTEEQNELNVNMKYRLRLNNVYVIGNKDTYVSVDQLKLTDVIAMNNSSDLYTLEWYWENAENDTEIGKKIYAEYKLKIKVKSELYKDKD